MPDSLSNIPLQQSWQPALSRSTRYLSENVRRTIDDYSPVHVGVLEASKLVGVRIDMMGIEYEADVRRQRDEKRGVPFQHCWRNSTKRQGRNEDDLHLLA